MTDSKEGNAYGVGEQQAKVDLSQVCAHVYKVHVDGLNRTKNDLVASTVRDLFKVRSFEEMIAESQSAKGKLELFGIFNQVSIFVDTSKDQCAGQDAYELFYKVKERRNIIGGVNTSLGTNTANVNFSLLVPNAFGRAEKLKADFLYGTKNTNSMSLTFSKPLISDPRKIWSFGALQNYMEFPWSSYNKVDRGITSEFSFNSKCYKQSLRWDGMWREIACMGDCVPMAVREHAGHSLKSSITHSVTVDTRDSPVLPSCGYMLNSTQELAGLGGDAKFGKVDIQAQVNQCLKPLGCVLQFSAGAGFVRSLSNSHCVSIADRFLLGGPLSLRGFHINGCGPHEESVSLGADTYWLANAHLYFPLPFRLGRTEFGNLFRTHLFVNAGNLTCIDICEPVADNLRNLRLNTRVSYGGGLVFRLGEIARLEFNYCMPLAAGKEDRLVDGLQFGIGLKFL